MRFSRVPIFALSLLLSGAAVFAQPPKVIKTSPESGADRVDPAAGKLVIVFDQSMAPGGYSLVGGGPTFPSLKGKPRWIDDRTLELEAELIADQGYQIGVNSATHQGFKNIQGEAAIPYVLKFHTAGGLGDEPIPADRIVQSIGQLRRLIDSDYSHRDSCGVDWPGRFAEFDARLRRCTTAGQFADVAAELLDAARDPHVGLRLGPGRQKGYSRNASPNGNAQLLTKLVGNMQQHGKGVATGAVSDGVGYLLIGGWNDAARAALPEIQKLLKNPAWENGLVIDVRFNGGGDDSIASQLAACFQDESSVYARVDRRDDSLPGGFTAPVDRRIDPAPEANRYRGPVAVLIGPVALSSNESFVLMMKRSPRCKLIGQTTGGSSGNPKPHPLECGVEVMLPSWREFQPDGTPIEKKGIDPDVRVEAEPGAFKAEDPVLMRAIAVLKEAARQ